MVLELTLRLKLNKESSDDATIMSPRSRRYKYAQIGVAVVTVTLFVLAISFAIRSIVRNPGEYIFANKEDLFLKTIAWSFFLMFFLMLLVNIALGLKIR